MNKDRVFCRIRKKYIVNTEEEEVRQSLISYLIENKSYPLSLFSVEGQIRVNNLIKRYDILVYRRDFTPFMLIECKAPHIPINQNVIDQISIYSHSIKAKYFIVTNGKETYCLSRNEEELNYRLEKEIPDFDSN